MGRGGAGRAGAGWYLRASSLGCWLGGCAWAQSGIEVTGLVVAVMNRKGGSGKTTTAFYLSMCAAREGREVVLVDADNEHGALAWAHLAEGLPFEVVLAEEDNLPSQVMELREAGKTVFVDGPPNNKEYVLSAAPIADRVLIPMTPEPADLNRLIPILKQLRNVEISLKRDVDVRVLLLKFSERTVLGREAMAGLQELGVPVLSATIRDLQRYKREFLKVPSYLSEYEAVWDELKE